MSLSKFLKQLQENGRVQIALAPDRSKPALQEFQNELIELDALARLDLAHEPPDFSLASAAWAAIVLYQGCQFLIHRDVGVDVVIDALSQPCPEASCPSVCYSVDLTFRYLPDLIALAKGIAEDDPLVGGLQLLAQKWPLSSVGAKNLKIGDITAFIRHSSLRRLYADRILEKRDLTRLSDPHAREAVHESLGAFPELAPEIAGILERWPLAGRINL